MAINLQKGQTIDLRKNAQGVDEFDLSTMTIGLGWDIRKPKSTGFLSGLFGGGKKEEDYDLDAIAFLLDKNDQVTNLGKELNINGHRVGLNQSDVVFFNNLSMPSGSFGIYHGLSKSDTQRKVQQLIAQGEYIIHTGDNLTGDGDGDDEQIILRLNAVPERINKIIFVVCIYQGTQKNQHFGNVENAFVRAVDAKGKEIARFSLSGEEAYNGMASMVFAEIYRRDGAWKFRALGNPHKEDSFIGILKNYVPNA